MSNEDKRTAVGISVTLSTNLIAAALAMLAVQGAFVAYALGDRQTKASFGAVAVVAAACFVISVFVAGKGITISRNAGYTGSWDLSAGKSYFNWQAILLVLGLLLFGATLLLSGTSRDEAIGVKVHDLRSDLLELEGRIQHLATGHDAQEESLESVTTSLRELDENVTDLREAWDARTADP